MTAHRSIRLGSMSLGTLCRSLVLPLLLLIAQQGAVLHGLSHFTWPAEVQLARPLQAEPPQLHFRIKVLLPNSDSTRSTASSAVAFLTSNAGLSSITSSEARRPVSAIISMHSCASR